MFDEHFDASTLHLLRARVADCVAAAGVPADRGLEVILALHELAANVIRHGAGAGNLLVRARAGLLRCQVSDARPGSGPWPVQRGHGLWIVQSVADKFTVSSGAHGSQGTAEFSWPAGSGFRPEPA